MVGWAIPFLVCAALVCLLLAYYLLSRPRLCNYGGKSPRYPPIREVLARQPSAHSYGVYNLAFPQVSGRLLVVLARLACSRLGQLVLVPRLLVQGANLRRIGGVYLPETPILYPTPCYPPPISGDYRGLNHRILQELVKSAEEEHVETTGFSFPTVADYHRAYKSGRCTPTDVAEAALRAIELSNSLSPPLRAIIDSDRCVVLAMAEASTERWKTGNTLSLLDGILVSVKGSYQVEPYQCLSGCAKTPEICLGLREAPVVMKLKEAGAVIIGLANLHELGTGALGSNPNSRHLTCRNPYDTGYYCGGSSSGSAASVAAGLCPISIGGDGGGSIRIPAASCGVVGLKQTFGLVDLEGGCPDTFSVATSGPISSSVLDAAITNHVMTRETDGERVLSSLEGLDSTRDLSGVKVGVYWEYFNHADPEIVARCKTALSVLESLGAQVVEVTIPELEGSRVAHIISIVSEMSHSLAMDMDKNFSMLNPETVIFTALGLPLTSNEYINAQKQRTRALACLAHTFEQVDMIVTPTTACTIKPISEAAIAHGELDASVTGELSRFTFLANLCGNPALTVPVGYTNKRGLPIGVQMMGRHYEERVLLRLGLALEQSGKFPTKKPRVFYDLISN